MGALRPACVRCSLFAPSRRPGCVALQSERLSSLISHGALGPIVNV
jgi:hypothetical protein